MDKLKSVLSGEESRRDDRNILQSVNEASTLGWGTRIKGFIACFVVGAACTVLVIIFWYKRGPYLPNVHYYFLANRLQYIPKWLKHNSLDESW
uniref:Uncharacterized protein n=1 Tax=Fundulus heteroclitus TaxID=8078 RepID=A0A3Q2PEE4_FUNHE